MSPKRMKFWRTLQTKSGGHCSLNLPPTTQRQRSLTQSLELGDATSSWINHYLYNSPLTVYYTPIYQVLVESWLVFVIKITIN